MRHIFCSIAKLPVMLFQSLDVANVFKGNAHKLVIVLAVGALHGVSYFMPEHVVNRVLNAFIDIQRSARLCAPGTFALIGDKP